MTWREKEKVLAQIYAMKREEQSWKRYYEQNADYIINVQEQTVFERLKQIRLQIQHLENLINRKRIA